MSPLALTLAALLHPIAAPAAEPVDPRYFIGTWSCQGQVAPALGGLPHAAVGLWRLDSRHGAAFLWESLQTHTDQGDHYHAWGKIEFDRTGGKVHRWSINSWLGGDSTAADGWHDDVLVWEGYERSAAYSGRRPLRETFTRQSADRIAMVREVTRDGEAVAQLEFTCSRLLWAPSQDDVGGANDPADTTEDAPGAEDATHAGGTVAAADDATHAGGTVAAADDATDAGGTATTADDLVHAADTAVADDVVHADAAGAAAPAAPAASKVR